MRIDANHGGKPQYHPNSYSTPNNSSMTKKRAPGYMPEAAEAPYQVANNVVSRQSYYIHEGDPSEYNQVRELYQRVMTDAQRNNLHKNTADLLRVSTDSLPLSVSLRGSFTDI